MRRRARAPHRSTPTCGPPGNVELGHGVTRLPRSPEDPDGGVIILGDDTRLEEGGEVRATGKLLQVPAGKGLLGRVVNTLGEPLDGKGPVASDAAYPVE